MDRFDDLINKYNDELRAVCYSVCKGRYELDDAYQESLLHLYKQFSSEIKEEEFLKWAEAKVFNHTRNLVKRGQRLYNEEGKLIKTYNKQPDILYDPTTYEWAIQISGEPMTHNPRTRLYSALNRLPFNYKQAINLVMLQGMSKKGAAEYLGVTESCLRQRLHRAKEMLKVYL